ncbi:hypothetical protein NXX18_20615 [Bacteroides fragilis]|nr:hypothetical protein [Bacteroides fragilis]
MKQATTGNKDIIKKLLTDSLSPEEREKLNNYKFVNQAIYSQWEQVSDMYTDVDMEERMLTNVMHQIKKGKPDVLGKPTSVWLGGIYSFIADLRNTIFNVIIQKSRAGGLVCTEPGRQSSRFGKISDGTLVGMLNAGSRLTYPKEFSGNKGKQLFPESFLVFIRIRHTLLL